MSRLFEAGTTLAVFTEVIDNFGDAGVAWRLAREAARRGATVRLVADKLEPFAFLCGSDSGRDVQDVSGVTLVKRSAFELLPVAVDDIVLEIFAVRLPARYEAALKACAEPVFWANFDYLTSEAWAADFNERPSLDPASGKPKTNFFPGLAPGCAPVVIEADYLAGKEAFEPDKWLGRLGLSTPSAFYFGYPGAPVGDIACALAEAGFASVACAQGKAGEDLALALAGTGVKTVALPFFPQPELDCHLWASALNFVRGEDSLVRAVLAGRPFLWQVYPSEDARQTEKLAGFLEAARPAFATSEAFALWRKANERLNGFNADSSALAAFARASGKFLEDFARLSSMLVENGSFLDRLAQCAKNR